MPRRRPAASIVIAFPRRELTAARHITCKRDDPARAGCQVTLLDQERGDDSMSSNPPDERTSSAAEPRSGELHGGAMRDADLEQGGARYGNERQLSSRAERAI